VISPRRLDANRRNALRSTGPKSVMGKREASQNALRHGLRAESPVVRGVEKVSDWRAHRLGVVRSLEPVGYLEESLADRIALQQWRLRRVVRYEREKLRSLRETAADAVGQLILASGDEGVDEAPTSIREAESIIDGWREVQTRLEDLLDISESTQLPGATIYRVGSFLAEMVGRTTEELTLVLPSGAESVPLEDLADDPGEWPAVTLISILNALAAPMTFEVFRASAVAEAVRRRELAVQARSSLEAQIRRLRSERLLASDHELEKVSRYEAALERSLLRTLHELQRLQAARQGGTSAPMALDLDLAGS
jgi:hypothetical protein